MLEKEVKKGLMELTAERPWGESDRLLAFTS